MRTRRDEEKFVPFRRYRTTKGGYYQGQHTKAYWKQRNRERLSEAFAKADELIEHEQHIYEKALRQFVADFKVVMRPFMKNGEFDEVLFAKARANGTLLYQQQELLAKIAKICQFIPDRQTAEVEALLVGVYKDTSESLAKDLDIVYEFDEMVAKTAVRTPWTKDGREFSDRIWKYREQLEAELRTTLTEAIIRGENPNTTIGKFKERFGNTTYNTARLIRTETCAIQTKASIERYKEANVEYLEVIGSGTDKACASAVGKLVSVGEAEVGVNVPPKHPFVSAPSYQL